MGEVCSEVKIYGEGDVESWRDVGRGRER